MIDKKRFHVEERQFIQKGIFLRSPIQKIETSTDSDLVNWKSSSWETIKVLHEKSFRGFILRFVNPEIVKKGRLYKKWKFITKEWGAEGFSCNFIVSPIYTSRIVRSLDVVAINPDEKILELHSWGYESEFNDCAGQCEKEFTRILKNTYKGNKWFSFQSNNGKSYQYIYQHKVEEII